MTGVRDRRVVPEIQPGSGRYSGNPRKPCGKKGWTAVPAQPAAVRLSFCPVLCGQQWDRMDETLRFYAGRGLPERRPPAQNFSRARAGSPPGSTAAGR